MNSIRDKYALITPVDVHSYDVTMQIAVDDTNGQDVELRDAAIRDVIAMTRRSSRRPQGSITAIAWWNSEYPNGEPYRVKVPKDADA